MHIKKHILVYTENEHNPSSTTTPSNYNIYMPLSITHFSNTVTQIVAKDNVDSNNANNNAIVFQEKVTWFNLDKPIEAILTIYKNENAAEVTREFYNRYAINEDALFSLLDRVYVVIAFVNHMILFLMKLLILIMKKRKQKV